MSLAYNTISFIIEIAWDIITEFATEILKSSKLEEELEEDKEREDVLRFVVIKIPIALDFKSPLHLNGVIK